MHWGSKLLQILQEVRSNCKTRNQLIRKAREYEEAIRQSFAANAQESRKFRTTITSSAAIPRAQDAGKTVFQTEPEHEATQQFLAIARELEERIAEFEPATHSVREGGVAHG